MTLCVMTFWAFPRQPVQCRCTNSNRTRWESRPMESVAGDLHDALPQLSTPVRMILSALAASAGSISSADAFAVACGLHSRHQLGGLLRREGLPQIEELTGWITVLTLLRQREVSGWSLYRGALEVSKWPPTCYRTVKRLTGTTWRRACDEGFYRLLDRFVSRCRDLRLANGHRKLWRSVGEESAGDGHVTEVPLGRYVR